LNKLKLKIATQEYVIYSYTPEGEGIPGEIRMNIGDDEATVIFRAGEDNSTGRYAFKATKAVKGCVERKNFPLEFTQAWV
jgi:hypothetical protein